MKKQGETLLEIRNLSISFRMYQGRFRQKELKVISDLNLTVRSGEILAVAGSSGSGKSILASAILGILPKNAKVEGEIHYRGEELTAERQRKLCGKEISLIPQSVAYLDPLMKTGTQTEGHYRYQWMEKKKLVEKRRKIFNRLNLPLATEQLYPYQLSGGMARRVLLSTALITDAGLIIADEPTPGMGLEQALEALTIFREMADEGKAVLLITHDIDLAVEFADKVAVFYAGTTVETALASDFQAGPEALRHPYSKALWRALPQNGFVPIPGVQPYADNLPPGCLFAPRCIYKTGECEKNIPPVRQIRGGDVRCHHGS